MTEAGSRDNGAIARPDANTQVSGQQNADLRAEIETLRKTNNVQSAELASLRWHVNSLLRQHPLLKQSTRIKKFLRGRFPRYVDLTLHSIRTLRRSASAIKAKVLSRNSDRVAFDKSQANAALPILIADGGSYGRWLSDQGDKRRVVTLSPGAGSTKSLPVAPDGEPTLRSAEAGSFIDWMISSGNELRTVGTIVLDAGDDVSLGLVRGGLFEGKSLLITRYDAVSPRVVELGPPQSEDGIVSRYNRFPDEWLDPLGRSESQDQSKLANREWPKISVVMVSFNQADFLEEGIRSILDQGYPNLEFIVVDGKSTDGSVDILDRFRENIDLLIIEKDKGQSDGLNKGFAKATGEILTWVNSDDLLEPNALFRVAQAFRAYDVDMVVGGCRQIGLTRTTIIRNHHTKLPYGTPIALPLGLLLEMERFWLTASFFYQPEVFFSRDIWLRSGGALRTDLYYILDYDLWVRMAAAAATIVHIPDFLACSRTHDQQKTTAGMPYLPEVQRLLREYASSLLVTAQGS